MSVNTVISSESSILYERIADTYEHLYYTDAKLVLEQPFLDKLLSLLPVHPRILDLGCGTAVEARYFIDHGANYTGIDASASMIAIARRHSPGGVFRVGDIRALPFEQNSFDGVIALDSLIHFPKAEMPRILRGISKVLSPDGAFLIAVQAGDGEQVMDFGLGLNHKTLVSLYSLHELSGLLYDLGLETCFSASRDLMEGEFPFPQLYILSTRSSVSCWPPTW